MSSIQILEQALNNTLEVKEKEASKLVHTQVLLRRVSLIEVQQVINIEVEECTASRSFCSIKLATNMKDVKVSFDGCKDRNRDKARCLE